MRSGIRLWLLPAAFGMLAGCDVRDAMRAHVDVVADAAGHELTVDRLAEISAQGRAVLLQDDVIERVAGLWVDYILFAQKLADGDSLLDSATVTRAMWGEVRQTIVDRLHDDLVDDGVTLTAEFVDSAYQAGDHRIIHHILFRTLPDMTAPDRSAQKVKATRLRQGVSSGRVAWARANDQNEDYASKAAGGNLGLVRRGSTVPQFGSVAFALAPGEISAVTETPFGYHVIKRPALVEVREEFTGAIENLLIEQMDSTFLADMESRWDVAVDEDAPALAREAIADLERAKRSKKVAGTYRGGRFTVSDYAKWLQTLDVRFQGQVAQADDAQLMDFVRALMRNHVLVLEAEQQGHTLTEDDLYALTMGFSDMIAPLRAELGLDSVIAATADPRLRYRAVEAQVSAYLMAVVSNRRDLVTVPPFLADLLREEADWSISKAGVDRVVERAAELRVQLDSMTPPPEPVDSGTIGGLQ